MSWLVGSTFVQTDSSEWLVWVVIGKPVDVGVGGGEVIQSGWCRTDTATGGVGVEGVAR